jgi:hypothetical protein
MVCRICAESRFGQLPRSALTRRCDLEPFFNPAPRGAQIPLDAVLTHAASVLFIGPVDRSREAADSPNDRTPKLEER